MGEYAKNRAGERIKIGTCEDMYYLRADQRFLVQHEQGNVNPGRNDEAGQIRFRFPWPDEDNVKPGAFQYPFRTLGITGADELLEGGLDHSFLQFTRNYPQSGGVLLSTPCPESEEGKASGLKFLMATEPDESSDNPAITFLTKRRDIYAATLKRLTAQHKGVQAKMFSTQAKLEATEEALKALAPKSGSGEDLKP